EIESVRIETPSRILEGGFSFYFTFLTSYLLSHQLPSLNKIPHAFTVLSIQQKKNLSRLATVEITEIRIFNTSTVYANFKKGFFRPFRDDALSQTTWIC